MKRIVFPVAIVFFIILIGCAKETAEKPKEQLVEQPVEQPPKLTLFSSRAPVYSVEYAMKVSGPQFVEGAVSVAAKDFQNDRYADIVTSTKISIQGNDVVSAMYFLENKGYSCSEQQTWSCVEIPAQQVAAAHSASGSQTQFEQNPEAYKTKSLGQRTLLGEQVSCFEATFEPAGTSVLTEYCYTSDGVPLLIKSTVGEVTSELTATSFSRSASDDVFKLPAEPKTL